MNEPIIVERTLPAAPEKVWKAITDKDEMKKWYFNLKEFDPKIGFEFQFTGGPDEGKQYLHLCKITEAIPNKKLTYSWRYDGYEGNSFVTFELNADGSKTKLKLTHSGLETFPADVPDFARENFVKGWNEIVDQSLIPYLEGVRV